MANIPAYSASLIPKKICKIFLGLKHEFELLIIRLLLVVPCLFVNRPIFETHLRLSHRKTHSTNEMSVDVLSVHEMSEDEMCVDEMSAEDICIQDTLKQDVFKMRCV